VQLNPYRNNLEIARNLWGDLSPIAVRCLEDLSRRYLLSIASGDLLYLEGKWYVTHSGLLGIACRKRCLGIQVRPAIGFCDPAASRWAFKATVYKSRTCKGFVGYGDADPSNVSPMVRGAEMRVAETRAVNRALRKAYGIGTDLMPLGENIEGLHCGPDGCLGRRWQRVLRPLTAASTTKGLCAFWLLRSEVIS
jgi:hypothetical protein